MSGTLLDLVGQIDSTHDAFHAGIQWVIKMDREEKFRLIDKAHGRFYLCDCVDEVVVFFGESWCQDDQWQIRTLVC